MLLSTIWGAALFLGFGMSVPISSSPLHPPTQG